MKTKKQIVEEIKALKTVRPNVRSTTMFGDDNLAALDAQIDVLENYLDEDEIYDKYDCTQYSEYILDGAICARQWIDDEEDLDDNSLAESWPLKKEAE